MLGFLRRYSKFILLTLIALAILWYFGRSVNWDDVGSSLRRANPVLVAISVLIICLGYLLRAYRWRTLLAPITESDLTTLFETTTIGFAAVFLFGRAGEVVRPLWLPMRDARVRPTAAFVTIGVERICDLTAIIILFVINFIWFRPPAGREAEFAFVNQIGYLLLVCTLAGVAALFVFQRLSTKVVSFADDWLFNRRWFPKRIALQLRKLLDHLALSLQILTARRELLVVSLWTMALWFGISLPTWLVIRSFGLPFGFSDTLFVMGWALVGSLVPTPGGSAGAFHTATAGALIFLGVNREVAVAVAIIMHLVYFAPALVFGIYYFLRGRVDISGIRSLVISSESPATSISADKPVIPIYTQGAPRGNES